MYLLHVIFGVGFPDARQTNVMISPTLAEISGEMFRIVGGTKSETFTCIKKGIGKSASEYHILKACIHKFESQYGEI